MIRIKFLLSVFSGISIVAQSLLAVLLSFCRVSVLGGVTWRLVICDSAILFHAECEFGGRRDDVFVGFFDVILPGRGSFNDLVRLRSRLQ